MIYYSIVEKNKGVGLLRKLEEVEDPAVVVDKPSCLLKLHSESLYFCILHIVKEKKQSMVLIFLSGFTTLGFLGI
jgi:hypothetical protein